MEIFVIIALKLKLSLAFLTFFGMPQKQQVKIEVEQMKAGEALRIEIDRLDLEDKKLQLENLRREED